MKMDEDDRKKLETFWRRKLWLGLAAVGALVLAAWRVAAVQDRYDDVLVQESRELPEKVYQELVAEVRKGVPILPNHPPGTDFSKYNDGKPAIRCDSILALGFLRDSRAIPELRKLLNDDINRAKSCNHHYIYNFTSQEFSAYGSAVSALNQFKEKVSITSLKESILRVPSPQLITIWRDFQRREEEAAKQNQNYDTQPIPNLENKNISDQTMDYAGEDSSSQYIRGLLRVQTAAFPIELRTELQNDDKDFQESILRELSENEIQDIFDRGRIRLDLMRVHNVRKEIVKVFEDNKSSVTKLSNIRRNLKGLNYDNSLSKILSDILMVDVRKGRKISPNDFTDKNPSRGSYSIKELKDLLSARPIPGKKSLDYSTLNFRVLKYLLSSSDPAIRSSVEIALNRMVSISQEAGDKTLEKIRDLQNESIQTKQLAIDDIGYSIYRDSTIDSRIVPAILLSLKSLNEESSSIKNWIKGVSGRRNLSGRYLFRSDILDSLELIVDRGLIDNKSRKAVILTLMKTYKNWGNLPNDLPRPIESGYPFVAVLKQGRPHTSQPQSAGVVRLIRKLNATQAIDRTSQQRTQQLFYLETGILGAIGVTAIGLLLSSIRLRNPFSLFFSTYLIFPEEVVAELIALKQRRQSEKVRRWQIRLELAYEIITLIWAFQIQIRIDDRTFPPGGNRSAK